MKLIRLRICPDVTAPDDSVAGMWHKGYRRPDSETTAIFHRKKWWRSTAEMPVAGPFETKEIALTTQTP
jgi:hypothetical protein